MILAEEVSELWKLPNFLLLAGLLGYLIQEARRAAPGFPFAANPREIWKPERKPKRTRKRALPRCRRKSPIWIAKSPNSALPHGPDLEAKLSGYAAMRKPK